MVPVLGTYVHDLACLALVVNGKAPLQAEAQFHKSSHAMPSSISSLIELAA